jgi:hypothetical protein
MRARLLPVLLLTDLFHPVNDLAVELFLNGDVRHSGGRRRTVPVFLAGLKPDHITGPDLLGRRRRRMMTNWPRFDRLDRAADLLDDAAVLVSYWGWLTDRIDTPLIPKVRPATHRLRTS